MVFEERLTQACSDPPVAAPPPFQPSFLVGFVDGTLLISVRYTVDTDGALEDAVVSEASLSQDARPLTRRQLDDLRREVPRQIEAQSRLAPGPLRVCEQFFGWSSAD
jgi:hypothetical protein